MPDVGVLNLTIQDNAKYAGTSLKTLAQRLTDVKAAVGNGLGLDKVASEVQNLANSFSQSQSTTIQRIGTLFNAINNFSKLKSFTLPTEPFKKLKTAIDGIDMGTMGTQLNAFRNAINGDWSGAESSKTAMIAIRDGAGALAKGNTAQKLRDAAAGMKEYANALKELKKADSALGKSSIEQMEDEYKDKKGRLLGVTNLGATGQKMRLNIQQFGGKKAYGSSSGEQLKMDLEKLTGTVDGLEKVESVIEKIVQPVETFKETVDKTGSSVKSAEINKYLTDPITSLMDRVSNVASSTELFGDKLETTAHKGKFLSAEAITMTKNIQMLIKAMDDVDKNKKGKGFSNIVDIVSGVTRANTNLAADAAKSFDAKFFEKADRVGKVLDELDHPKGTASAWSSEFFDKAMGIANETKDTINETNSMFNIPSKDSAFESAAEEIYHYTEAVNRAREDTSFWENEYERIQKRIKYNGATEERKNELAQAERSWEYSIEKLEEYESKLASVKEMVSQYDSTVANVAQTATEDANAVGEHLADGIDRATEHISAFFVRFNKEKDAFEAYDPFTKKTITPYGDMQEQLDAATATYRNSSEEIKQQMREGTLFAGKEFEKMGEKGSEAITTVTSKTKEARDIFREFDEKVRQAADEFMAVNDEVTLLTMKINALKEKLGFGIINHTLDQKQIATLGQQIMNLEAKLEKAKAKAGEATTQASPVTPEMNEQIANARANIDEFVDKMNMAKSTAATKAWEIQDAINQLMAQENEMIDALAREGTAGELSARNTVERLVAIRQLRDEQQKLLDQLNELEKSNRLSTRVINGIKDAFEGLKKGIHNIFPGLRKLALQFVSIARRMAIRAIIKQFTGGLREGLENVYYYSKAVGTSFAPSMDSAASSLLQMKNSIGAALAPAVQALIPVLQTVVNWFINLINYVNQFFALLNGQTEWTRALPATTTAFKDQTKEAKKAGSAMKDLLADWDELNIIQSQSGGNGAGAAAANATDYTTMFEQVHEFDQGIKDTVEFIQTHMDDILRIAKIIGATILAWKVSKAFSSMLGDLGSVVSGSIVSIGLVIGGIALSSSAGWNAGMSGQWDTASLIEAIGGTLAAGIGGAYLGAQIGGLWGGVIGFAVGVGLSVAITAVSFFTANQTRLKMLKWGNSDYTTEQIQAWVNKQFTFDVTGTINVLKTNTQMIKEARQNLSTEISELNTLLSTKKLEIQMGIAEVGEGGTVDYTQLLGQANQVITALQGNFTATQNAVQAYLTLTNSEDINTILNDLTTADSIVMDNMRKLGAKLAKEINAGMDDTLDEGWKERALKITERILNIMSDSERREQEIAISRAIGQANGIDLASMGYEDAQEAYEYQKSQVDKVKEEFIQNRRALEGEYRHSLALAEAQLADLELNEPENKFDIEQLNKAIEIYKQQLEKYSSGLDESEWRALAGDTDEMFRQMWLEKIRASEDLNWYGNGVFDLATIVPKMGGVIADYKNGKRNGELTDAFLEALNSGSWGYSQLANQIMGDQKISAIEGLNTEGIRKFIDGTIELAEKLYGVNGEDFIRDAFSGIKGGDRIISYLDNEYQELKKERIRSAKYEAFDQILEMNGISPNLDSRNYARNRLAAGSDAEWELFKTLLENVNAYTGMDASELSKNIEQMYESFIGKNESLFEGIDPSYIKDYMMKIIDSRYHNSDTTNKVVDAVTDYAEEVFATTGQVATEAATVVGESAIDFGKHIFDTTTQTAKDVSDSVKNSAIEFGKNIFDTQTQAAKDARDSIKDAAIGFIESIFDTQTQGTNDSDYKGAIKEALATGDWTGNITGLVNKYISDNGLDPDKFDDYYKIAYDVFKEMNQTPKGTVDTNPSGVPEYQFTKDNDMWPGKEDEDAEMVTTTIETDGETRNSLLNTLITNLVNVSALLNNIDKSTAATAGNTAQPPTVVLNASTALGRVVETATGNYNNKVKGFG